MKTIKLLDTTIEDLVKTYLRITAKPSQMDFFSYMRIDLALSASAERMANAYKKVLKKNTDD